MRRAAGFTLIEILLVVAVIGVLAAMTAPIVAGAMDRYTVISASQQVASTIRLARFQAVARNQTLEVQFDAGAGEYRVFEADGVTPVGQLQLLSAAVSFGEGSATVVEIAPTGRVVTVGCPCNIVVTNGNAELDRTITVSTSGRVQLQ